jgi:hypothetical protein
MSRIFFRGPRRSLDGQYVAFLGGAETYGKFIEKPFPALVEQALGQTCVNFGVVNASVDAFLHDPTVMAACHDAEVTVLQIAGAQNLSNRFYKVHPRRNDRFVGASTVMRALYSDVDFADFSFTRHMLSALYAKSAERFEIVRAELQAAWFERMRVLIQQIDSKVVLFWFAESPLSDDHWTEHPKPFRAEPLFITRKMVEALRPFAHDIIEAQPSATALAMGTKGMVFPIVYAEAAAELLGVAAHKEAAALLTRKLRAVVK